MDIKLLYHKVEQIYRSKRKETKYNCKYISAIIYLSANVNMCVYMYRSYRSTQSVSYYGI